MLHGSNFVRLHYQKRAFGYRQCVDRNVASNEKFAPANAAIGINFHAVVAHQVFEPIRRCEIADTSRTTHCR